jgi:hypothetical protein
LSDDTLTASTFQQLATPKLKSSQGVDYILPFALVSGLQDAGRIPPFVHLIVRHDIIGDEVERYHVRHNGVIRD